MEAADPADDEDIANAGRVSIGDDDTSITVKLSNDWRSGGELVVVLRNVQTAVPRSLSSTTGAEAETIPVFLIITIRSWSVPRSRVVSISWILSASIMMEIMRIMTAVPEADDTDKVYSRQPAVRVGNILGSVVYWCR